MKSESKKFEPKEVKRKWLISYEVYRVTTSITTRVDVGTKVVEAVSLLKAYEDMKLENHKVVIISIYEL
jgi:hypothetical protein